MKRNANYVMSKIIDPLRLAKKAQVGVDLTIKSVSKIQAAYTLYEDDNMSYSKHTCVAIMPKNGKLVMPPLFWGEMWVPPAYEDAFDGPVSVAVDTYTTVPMLEEAECWYLLPGVYAIEFDQGLKQLASDENAYIIQRSSLNRVGTRIEGSIFDPGFGTDTLGATMFVWVPLYVYQHARVAQITIEKNEPVEEVYDGTWQGKANV